jgi:hypothetical protein
VDQLYDAFEAEWSVEDHFGRKNKPTVIGSSVPEKRPNHAMQANRDPACDLLSMCLPYTLGCVSRFSGPAVADLVYR